MNRKKTLAIALIVMGLSGIIAQILLLRELIINFYGNELSIGIILANWLLLESAGAFFLGKQIEKIQSKIAAFILVTIIFSLSFPMSIYLARISKNILGITPAEAAGIVKIFYSSFLVLLPVSLTHGALFTFGCKIHSLSFGNDTTDVSQAASSIGGVYIYETTGTILGGACLTFFLIPYFGSFQIAFGLAILNIIMCLAIGIGFCKGYCSNIKKLALTASILLLIVLGYTLVSPLVDKIHLYSLRNRWPGQEIVYYKNSIYGNVAVTKSYEQYTFLSNGVTVITVPTPDISGIEEFVHLPMLFHPDPKKILIISGGAGGTINEILKHNIEKIDYVELDPLILTAVKEFPVELTEKELSNPKVNIEYIDGRVFVKTTPLKYDVIFIGLDDPSSLSANRLFTKEFFCLLKNRLTPDGIIAFRLPGSVTYLGPEIKDLNACILNSLRKAFLYTKIIPGDETNIYLASSSQQLLKVDKDMLVKRFKLKDIHASLISPFHIEYKLQPQWIEWFKDSLKDATKKQNQDFRPIATFFSLSYWNAMFSPYMQNAFRTFEQLTLKFLVFVFIILGILAGGMLFISKHPFRLSLPISIAATGFSGMLFNLIIIFSFQIIYGYVFYWLGILVSIFMTGTLAGSFWVIRKLGKINNELSFFLKTEAIIIIFALILPLALTACRHAMPGGLTFLNLKIVFIIISLLSGLVVGIQFPLANKIHLAQNQSGISKTAGLLYSSDLLGGWVSGVMGGVILLPVLGVLNSCLLIVALKSMTFLIFALSIVKQRN